MECIICKEEKSSTTKCTNCECYTCYTCREIWKKKNYGLYNCPYKCDIKIYTYPKFYYKSYLLLLLSNILLFFIPLEMYYLNIIFFYTPSNN